MDSGASEQFSDSSERLVSEVATAIATEVGRKPTEIPPLSETIDPEAMARVVDSTREAALRFTHAGCHVELRVADGRSGLTVERVAEARQ
jgi:hypothetical protein